MRDRDRETQTDRQRQRDSDRETERQRVNEKLSRQKLNQPKEHKCTDNPVSVMKTRQNVRVS